MCPMGVYCNQFQSTHPARGATLTCRLARLSTRYFNPRTPRGVRRLAAEYLVFRQQFQSTHPARGATQTGSQTGGLKHISIHAPREGCDCVPGPQPGAPTHFNPRTPRGVRPVGSSRALVVLTISIHAPREGCDPHGVYQQRQRYISIHAPREGCDSSETHALTAFLISIHAPREGCDDTQSNKEMHQSISIHAPREGCDDAYIQVGNVVYNFNPRTPRGVRQGSLTSAWATTPFQSTHPARGATKKEG